MRALCALLLVTWRACWLQFHWLFNSSALRLTIRCALQRSGLSTDRQVWLSRIEALDVHGVSNTQETVVDVKETVVETKKRVVIVNKRHIPILLSKITT